MRVITLVVFMVLSGFGFGLYKHAIFGRSVRAEVLAIERVMRDNTDSTMSEVSMPRLSFDDNGHKREEVVVNEYVFRDVRIGDDVDAWVVEDEVVMQDVGNDLLRGGLFTAIFGVTAYLGAAVASLAGERRRKTPR